MHTENVLVFVDFLLAMGIAAYTLPILVNTSHVKNLFAEPNKRTAAKKALPNVGGVSIFLGFVLSITLSVYFVNFNTDEFATLVYIIGASILLLFVGLKDDLVPISPKKKLLGQLLSILIVIMLADIRITSLFGVLFIEELSLLLSIPVTLFFFVFIINGLNLIDGIDGLASGTTCLISLLYAIWFVLIGDFLYAFLSASLAGTLVIFFYFNVFGKDHKTFMGDTGSLLLGLLISIISIHFLELNTTPYFRYSFEHALAIVVALLIVPIFDTIRVFVLRLWKGKSPFKADKNHVHHRLLTLRFSHFRASLTIIACNAMVILVVLLCDFYLSWNTFSLVLLALFMATILSIIPAILITRKINQTKSSNKNTS